MKLFSSLNKDQIKAIGLLQLGTFLEYFDFMIYIHLAVVLNSLFFPPSDPRTADLAAAMTFSLACVFRPFFALIFGYVGDRVGRKSVIIFTTLTMACACLVMANLPTYAQIGITASIAMVLCRIIQGVSSTGEASSANVYLAEIAKPPLRYSVVSSLECAYGAGSFLALGVITAIFYLGFEWRLAFWFGAIIAVVGLVARMQLKETPEFAAAKAEQLAAAKAEQLTVSSIINLKNPLKNNRVDIKTILGCFLVQ